MIVLKHSTGLIKECPTGYSWTTFFFGFFVPAFRGDLKWGIILFLTNLILAITTMGIGSLIANTVFAGFYNKLYIKDLIEKGYTAYDETAAGWLRMKAIIMSQEAASLQVQENKKTDKFIEEKKEN